MLYPPSPWTNSSVRLYHGTVERSASAIVSGGVNVSLGRSGTDFGPGFYTTTLERQAMTWAYQLAMRRPGARAAVVAFDVDRDALAGLDTLAFVRGDFYAEDFWSLVVHCRSGAHHHHRLRAPHRYDVVVGPVASFWQQRLIIADVDQMSFHTAGAQSVLNVSRRSVSWTSSP